MVRWERRQGRKHSVSSSAVSPIYVCVSDQSNGLKGAKHQGCQLIDEQKYSHSIALLHATVLVIE